MKFALRLLRRLLPALLSAPLLAAGQTWPEKPIRVVVPYPPGGVLDSLVRPLLDRLQAALRQPIYIENIPGAGGNIGMNTCSRAPADGYTFCITTNDSISFNPFLYTRMPYDPQELTPVQRLVWIDGAIVGTANSGLRNYADMVAKAKAKHQGVSFGSFGQGSAAHLYASALNAANEMQLLHVPYRGSAPLLQALLSGEVDTGFLATGILAQHIKSGRVFPLVATAPDRLSALPDTPTLKEVGLSFYIPAWFGMFAPKGTPAPLVERVATEVAGIVSNPAFATAVLGPAGFRVAVTTPSGFAEFLREDRLNGEKLVRLSGTTLD